MTPIKILIFLLNDFNWNYKELNFNSGIKSKIFGHFKNINYEPKNVDLYKKKPTTEFHGALGYLTQINLEKRENNSSHLLTPKFMIRYSPGSMRQESSGLRINPISAFSLDRLNNINNFETGLSGTFGFDYKVEVPIDNLIFLLLKLSMIKKTKKCIQKQV